MFQNGWGILCERSSAKRKEILCNYATNYVEPALDNFPELKGKIYLALRKNGFFAEYDPVYHIIVRESALNTYGQHLLKTITAHEMGHLLQYENEIGMNSQSLELEIQATLIALKRGFAKSFIMAFPENCRRNFCDGKEEHCYFKCNLLFQNCCKALSVATLEKKAECLKHISMKYTIDEKINISKISENIKSNLLSLG